MIVRRVIELFRRVDLLIVLTLIIFVSAQQVYADIVQVASSPGQKVEDFEVKTPSYQPQYAEFEPPLGTYTYRVSWQGIPAATVTVDVDQDGMQYRVHTFAKTYKAIDIFYRLRYRAGATISAIDYHPFTSFFEAKENSKVKRSELQFFPSGKIAATYKKNTNPNVKEVEFNPNNDTFDPFSAAFLARSLDWDQPGPKVFDAYNGKSRYLIEMDVVEKIKMEVNDRERQVWVIRPKVKKLGSKKNSKLRQARIYLTDDMEREVLQITSEVFIGTVKTKLVSFKPSVKPVPGTTLAAKSGKIYFK